MRHWIAALTLAVFPLVAAADADREAPSHHADHEATGHEAGHDATIRHSFEDVEHWVEVFDDPERDTWQKPKSLLGFLGIRRGDTVADLGAGTGYFTKLLSVQVGSTGKIYAIDVEQAMLDHLMQRDDVIAERVVPVLAEPGDPGLPDGEVDIVTGVVPGSDPDGEEVLLVAHLYEVGANDNMSGAAVCIEAARSLGRLVEQDVLARPRRSVRVLLCYEQYGTIAFLDMHRKLVPRIVAGLNADMVGEDQELCGSVLQIDRTPPAPLLVHQVMPA